MRTGTRTVREPSLMMSEPETIWGRWARTASRIFSLCRNQSREPRENRSYQPLRLPGSLLDESVLIEYPVAVLFSYGYLFLRQQRRDVVQCLLRTVLVITILLHQPFLNDGYLLACLVIRTRGGSDQAQHVAALLE